jgi:thermostable 8-oxoguanine DNA glycosylase
MKLNWQIEPADVARVGSLLELHQDDPFVQYRVARNLRKEKPEVPKEEFWKALVSCLLTSQQRSGPGTPVTRFTSTVPFPLDYHLCRSQRDLRSFAQDTLTSFGGIRFSNRLADHVAENLDLLEVGLWSETLTVLDELRLAQTLESERMAAGFVAEHFKGFGPKQSRNLLQSLGLTRFEIPIDSRITKWLNDFGFPVRLSAEALSDANYYVFVSEGFQQLCDKSGVFPCVLDAAIFASYDKGGWTEDNVVW